MGGIPVRLVRRDGIEIRLDCTDYMMQVNRLVKATPIPFTGERFGGDLNMVTTSIRLNVVLRDDNCEKIESELKPASAYLDFSTTAQKLTLVDYLPTRYMKADAPDALVTRASLDNAVLEIVAKPADGEEEVTLKITLTDNTAGSHSGLSNNQPEMTLNMQQTQGSIQKLDPEPTGAEVATFIKSYIAANTTFSSLVTATVVDSYAGEGSIVKLENVNKGKWTEYPSFSTTGDTPEINISPFFGGETQSCYSAGDKVQNLMGAVSNNTILGGVGSVFGMGGNKRGTLNLDYDFLNNQDSDAYESDYIVGLMIPYNSLVGVPAGTLQKDGPQSYMPRNFFYATGFAEGSKGADANSDKNASMEFSVGDKYTGIRGTVTALEFKYNAGSSVYEGSITFGPMDAIVGI